MSRRVISAAGRARRTPPVLPIWDRRSLLWTSATRSLRTKLGFGTCVGDLVRRARHKVPPHQNLRRERWTADQQESATRTAGETDLGTIGAKVIQNSLLQRLPFDGPRSSHDPRA